MTEICWKCKGLVGDGAVEPSALPNSTATETPIPDKVEIKELSIATVGSYITFGNYEQDNDIGNGKETIEWLVLAKQDNRLLVISRYALDCKPYSTSGSGVTWENSTLRTWLNKDFLNKAFSSVEQAQISTVTVSTDKMNTLFPTDPGKDTQDKIFLLSGSEAKQFFSSNATGKCLVTAYAKAQGAFTKEDNGGHWWLRSPGSRLQHNAMYVDGAGTVNAAGVNVNNSKYVVRPAMWIDLSATEAVSVDDDTAGQNVSSNSTAKETSIHDKTTIEALSTAFVGSYITFGAYEQDNNKVNGREPIEWLVLAEEDGRALVISRYALDCKPYSTSGSGVTWENSTLRTWLNKDFLNEAFSSVEQTQISTVTVSTDKMNTLFTTNPGKDTQDKIFLLSGSEVRRYFSSNMPGGCEVTAYAKERGAFTRNSNRGWWWLRSPGSYKQSNAMYVDGAGNVKAAGVNVNNSKYVVRPAMWIDLSAAEAVSVDDATINQTISSVATAEPHFDAEMFIAQSERLVSCNDTTPHIWVLNNYEHADTMHAMYAAYVYVEFLFQENVLHNKHQVTAAHLRHAIDNGNVYIGAPELTGDDVYIYFYGPNVACKVTYTPSKGTVSANFITNSPSKYRAESAVSAECQYYNEVDKDLLSFTAMMYAVADGYEEYE